MAQRRFDRLEEEIRREEAAFRGDPDAGPDELSPSSLWDRLTVGDVLLGGVAAAILLLLIFLAIAQLVRRGDATRSSSS